MKSFQEECATLASLETFDPRAFEGDEHVPQELCNVVLALALIYNDCKNTAYAVTLLKESRPPGKHERTAIRGAWSGIHGHLFRLLISSVHELLNLIQNHQDILSHEFLGKVVKQLPADSHKSWKSLLAVAAGATPKDPFGKLLVRIRNKTLFHYDPEEIYTGFKTVFLGPKRIQDRAYISRGRSMEESRFYFADAAADGYLLKMVGEHDAVVQLSKKLLQVLESLNLALRSLVNQFIQQRGFPYSNA